MRCEEVERETSVDVDGFGLDWRRRNVIYMLPKMFNLSKG